MIYIAFDISRFRRKATVKTVRHPIAIQEGGGLMATVASGAAGKCMCANCCMLGDGCGPERELML